MGPATRFPLVSSRLQRGVVLFVLLCAFGLRVATLTAQSLWRDEVDALRFAGEPFYVLVENFTRPGWNGPLFYVLFRGWVALCGRSEFALRFFSLLFGVLGVSLIYRLGREWFSVPVGTVAAAMLASSPYMVWYSQEAKMYALLCTLAMSVLYLYRRALAERDWRLWGVVIVLTWVTVGIHVLGVLLVLLMVALFFIWWPLAVPRWREASLALVGALLPALPALPWALPPLLHGGNIGHRFVPLPGMFSTMLYAFSRGILGVGDGVAEGVMTFALLAGVVLWPGVDLRRVVLGAERPALLQGWREAWGLLAWAVVPVVGLYLISLRVPMFVDRYLIWIGPAVYLLAARGVWQLWHRARLLATLCLIAILGIGTWGVWLQGVTPIKSDFRAAAEYVRQHRRAGELVMFHISYVRATFEYYYGDSAPYADGVVTDERTMPAEVDAAMRERTAGYEVVWLVLSEPEMWDRRGMTLKWFDEHATCEARADFVRVSVIKYRLRDVGLGCRFA